MSRHQIGQLIYVHFIICQLHLEAAPKTKHMESLLKSYTSKVCDSVAGAGPSRESTTHVTWNQAAGERGGGEWKKPEAKSGQNVGKL